MHTEREVWLSLYGLMHIGREIKLFPNGSCTLEERFDYDSMGYAYWKRGSVVFMFMHIGREVVRAH